MSLEKIQQGLITQLLTAFQNWEDTQRIAWENKPFTAPKAKPWMEFFFMPTGERIATLGADGYDRVDGLAQVNVNYPINIGEGNSRKTINELRACFKPQAILFDDQEIRIVSRSRTGGAQRDGFYKIPFTVRWFSHLTR